MYSERKSKITGHLIKHKSEILWLKDRNRKALMTLNPSNRYKMHSIVVKTLLITIKTILQLIHL